MDLENAANRGFLIWSWVALLAAYISSSAAISVQSYALTREGVRAYDLSSSVLVIAMFSLILPILTLIAGWLMLLRFSRFVFEHGVGAAGSSDHAEARFYFNRTVSYLVLTWMALLVLGLLPWILSAKSGLIR